MGEYIYDDRGWYVDVDSEKSERIIVPSGDVPFNQELAESIGFRKLPPEECQRINNGVSGFYEIDKEDFAQHQSIVFESIKRYGLI